MLKLRSNDVASGVHGGAEGKGKWQGKTFLIEQYHVIVEDVIAEGGFALVFLVKEKRGRKMALKRMAVNNEQDLYVVRQEIAITKALSDSPNSVTFVGSSIVRTSSEVYEVLILLELCAGGRVVDLMNSRLKTGFSEELILRIFTDVCQAVARLHHRTKPILHRDLKIENILIGSKENFVLCDYGSCTLKTMDPGVLGAVFCQEQISKYTTVSYRAPEMIILSSGTDITTKADIWALGCLLYKLCFFTTPFEENSLAIVAGTFTFPENSKYKTLHSLICYMLNSDADDRPDIWQVSEVAFRIRGMKNPIRNVFHSQPPPSTLPTPSCTKTHLSPEKPKDRVTSGSAPSVKERNPQASQLLVSANPKGRPRVRPTARAPSPNFTRSNMPSHLNVPSSPVVARSLDSGLDSFGCSIMVKYDQPTSRDVEHSHRGKCPINHSTKLDHFGQPFFAPEAHSKAIDKFGHVPFTADNNTTPSSLSQRGLSQRNCAVDEFGATHFTSQSFHPSRTIGHSEATDAFGSTPFLT